MVHFSLAVTFGSLAGNLTADSASLLLPNRFSTGRLGYWRPRFSRKTGVLQ
jgi:hypothetical protein